jgi:hypothetical protein
LSDSANGRRTSFDVAQPPQKSSQQLVEQVPVVQLEEQQSLQSSQQVTQQSQQLLEHAEVQQPPLLQQLSAWIIPPKPTAIKAARNIERVDFIEKLLFRSADEMNVALLRYDSLY